MNQRPGDDLRHADVVQLRPTGHPFRGRLADALRPPDNPAHAVQELLAAFAVPVDRDDDLTQLYDTYRAAAQRISQVLATAPPLALLDTLVALRWSRQQAVAAYLEA